ncbi:MAG TPA: biopolymer transporter ExbD [Myxococcales bacterium LLY-WYZ-16_1]|nr:biopolymer transporter ExbD [Myxococcales bacterium LLY-WYZ-16_1]
MSGGGGNDESSDFDLTALMDILSNIIFFLMASFGAAVVAVVPASVPTISEGGENDTAREEDKVTVTMKLEADGAVSISAANQDMLPEELAPYSKEIPSKDGTLDVRAVNDHLWSIKDEFRKSKDIMIVCADDVTYELLIEAMDASRERRMEVEGESVYPSMFPAAVVSSMAK